MEKKPSQKQRLLHLLLDYQWHSTPEILEKVYGAAHLGLSRIGARCYDLKTDGHDIEGKNDEVNKTIYHYRLKRKEPTQANLL